MIHANPFKGAIASRPEVHVIDAASRVLLVAGFTIEECELALKLPGLQKTVVKALKRRVRQLKLAVGR